MYYFKGCICIQIIDNVLVACVLVHISVFYGIVTLFISLLLYVLVLMHIYIFVHMPVNYKLATIVMFVIAFTLLNMWWLLYFCS